MHVTYKTNGVCARIIEFDINDGVVTNIQFAGGCNGNLKAISAILDGCSAEYICQKLEGNRCGNKNTSCADQLAQAVQPYIKQ